MVQSSGVIAPFLWVLALGRFCLCPPRLESLFPPVLWKSCNQIPLAFKFQISWGFPVPLSDPQAGKPEVGFRTFTTVGELFWYIFFPVCGSFTWREWDLSISWLCPSYCLTAALCLFLNMGYLLFSKFQCLCFWTRGIFYLVNSSVLLWMVVQQLVVILVLLQEEMSTRPSTLPSWTSQLFKDCRISFLFTVFFLGELIYSAVTSAYSDSVLLYFCLFCCFETCVPINII